MKIHKALLIPLSGLGLLPLAALLLAASPRVAWLLLTALVVLPLAAFLPARAAGAGASRRSTRPPRSGCRTR